MSRPGRAAPSLLAVAALVAAALLAACGRWGDRDGRAEDSNLPIEVTVEHPVDSPGAATLADPCAPPPGSREPELAPPTAPSAPLPK